MFNCGMMAVELSQEVVEDLFSTFSGCDTSVQTDFNAGTLTFSTGVESRTIPFTLTGFDVDLVNAGGWVEFADNNY